MKVIVFDIGGTLMEYKNMPLSWLDFYKDGFRYVCNELGLNITENDIDKSFEVLKSYNPRINPREIDVTPEVIFSEATAHWQGAFTLSDVINKFYESMKLTAYIYPETLDFLDKLKAEGYKMVLAVESGFEEKLAWECDYDFPLALIFGNEALGIDPEAIKLCDGVVSLPMFGDKASINVGNSAAAVLYAVLNKCGIRRF